MTFDLLHTDATSDARAGRITTAHGVIETPIFMPVGTVGSVKGLEPRDLIDPIRAQIILGNTYHLFLRPGTDLLEQVGGLHRFMRWTGPILTDSGGFQVFSLKGLRKITEEGVRFQSHLDGSYHWFTPESVVETQRSIGSDIMMVLDECPPSTVSHEVAKTSHELTVRWAKRCKAHFDATPPLYGYEQALFPIVQGALFPDLRRESARHLIDLDCPGYAIGGLAVGEGADEMYAMVEVCCAELPTTKPRYLMGVGTPANLIESVARGVDMFDCVMPTRNGRNGTLFTTEGVLNIRNKKWQTDFTPIDPGLESLAALGYTKAYLRHLFIAKEMLGPRLGSLQNLTFYLWLMREARQAILDNRFAAWKADILPRISRRL
ncbi:MAG: tRNA guanosine(34) transglycosylase Tgt [Bacteroidota bacterium]